MVLSGSTLADYGQDEDLSTFSTSTQIALSVLAIISSISISVFTSS